MCKQPNESGWVEFKRNNWSPQMIGEDISALANSAVLADRSHAYMIWGVDDATHEIVGTTVRLKSEKKGNQELENWLRYLLSRNADFEFYSVDVDGKHVEMIVLSRAEGLPVTFEKVDYIRSGSYTKKLVEFPSLQAQLWDKLRHNQFEDACSRNGLTGKMALRLLSYEAYFSLLRIPLPDETEQIVHYMLEEGFLARQDDGLFAITNLGAILLAKKLSEFPRLGRKAIRVVQYDKHNRLTILKEETFDEGYATGLEKVVKYVNTLLPSREAPDEVVLRTVSTFPLPAIRESIANAVIHQDFYITGAGPVVELFENRVEVTNPGVPLVDVMRIIDNPPKSRNEKLASVMRRMGMCEELGRGWDRMVLSCESQNLSAPRINVYQESTRVSLFAYLDFVNIQPDDRVWSTYLHACIKYIEGGALSNSSLRARFGLSATSSGMVSRLIKDVQGKKLIKPVDPETAPRYMRYIPGWA